MNPQFKVKLIQSKQFIGLYYLAWTLKTIILFVNANPTIYYHDFQFIQPFQVASPPCSPYS